jgi:iron complex outermembrane receptor protein
MGDSQMRLLSPSISAFALAVAGNYAIPALAQTSAASSPAATAATDQGIAEIIVTAQRRSENIQKIPLSVGVVDSQQLSAINSSGADIRGLSGRVPSLNIESSFGRTFPRFYIRGLGNTDFDLNASQPVSLVYDDVVLENPILKGFPAFDVNSVEVLRGPQGTLFGRNTPAGIVKFDTARPGSGHSYAHASYGSYSTINAEGALDAKLSDRAAIRVSGLWQHRNDWIDNLDAPGKHNLEGYDDYAVRAQVQLKPIDDLTIRLTGQLRHLDGDARIFRANSFVRGSNKLVGADGGSFKRSEVREDGTNFQKLSTQNVAGAIEYNLGPATLYSITSYWHGKVRSRGDIDGGCTETCASPPGPGFIPFFAESQDNVPSLDQFTQEVRIASNGGSHLGYQAGLFYFDENLNIESLDFGFPDTPVSSDPSAIVNQRQDAKSLGVFGSLNYHLDSGLTLQAGARWNHDKKKLVADRLFDIRPGFIGGGPVPQTATRVHDSQLTWDLSAVQELSRDVNIYARVAKGYRAPAIQGRILFTREVTTAKSENTMSYEAGVKSLLIDRLLRLNVDAYYFKTKDLQLSAVGGTTNANLLLNADAVKGYGFEAEMEARPAPGLTFTTGVSYNHTKIHDPNLTVSACGAVRVDTPPNWSLCTILDPIVVPAAPFSSAIVSIDGNSLPQAPKWTVNFTAGYEHPVGPGNIYLYTDWYYRSKVDFFLYKSVEFSDDHLLEGGLRIGYKWDRYDVAGFVRNITNDKSAVSGIDFNNLTAMVNEPRIWGIELGAKF